MSFLSRLLAKKGDPLHTVLYTYANLPLFQMLQEAEPFNDWRPDDAVIPAGLEDSFKIYTRK